jgi:hypothetical protein
VRYGLILALFVAIPCWSQTTTTGKAETKGPCSPAVTGSNDTFTINCGIDKKQGQRMLDILNKILANQLDPEAVMAKLDEILGALNPNKATVTYGFNGIKRTISPSRREADASGVDVFMEFGKKSNARDWLGLATLAEEQKKLRPEWLTPYYAGAQAYSQLCEKEKAVENLRYFLRKADDSPEYAEATPSAKQDLQSLEAGRWPSQCK